jgi:hypothetical protein
MTAPTNAAVPHLNDHRVSRIGAKARADAMRVDTATQARIREADAAAERRWRAERERQQLATERLTVKQQRQAAAEQRREQRAAARRDRWARRTRAVRAAGAGAVEYARRNAPAVYSAVIYGMAVAVAVGGQVTVATSRGYPVIAGVGMAVFVEGLALSMALTALQQRLRGERAFVARALTWAAALFAAGINYAAHAHDPVLAALLAASSLAGITVWEVRSGAKHRDTLRRAGVIPDPPPQLGWRRWVRYPASCLRAWSLDVRSRVSPAAARLIDRAEALHRDRRSDLADRRLVSACQWAAHRAARRGDATAAATMRRLAERIANETASTESRDCSAASEKNRTVPPRTETTDAATGEREPRGSESSRATTKGMSATERRMWQHWQKARAAGHIPNGAELDRIAGTNNYGRAVLRRWQKAGLVNPADFAAARSSTRSRTGGVPKP